jgi:hypothetical protein
MTIAIKCSCGKQYRVKEELAGKAVRCHHCGQAVRVPGHRAPIAFAEEPNPAGETKAKPHKQQAVPPSVHDEPEDREPVQIWTTKHGSAKGLTVLAEDAVGFAKLGGEELENAHANLEAGENVEDALGKKATIIPLESMLFVISKNYERSIFLDHWPRPKKERHEIISFEYEDVRDDFFKALKKKLGKGWRTERDEYNAVRAGKNPLILMALIVLFTGLLGLVLWQGGPLNRRGRPAAVEPLVRWMEDNLGVTGVIFIGLGLLVPCIVWFFFAIRKPPVVVKLKPGRNAWEVD